MRKCKKDYHTQLLDKNKSNVKGIWEVLNSIIRNKQANSAYPDHFIEKDRKITYMSEVVDGFNNFFVDAGPKLANEICNTGKSFDVENCGESNCAAISLGTVEKEDIIDMVNKCMNKTSTDGDDIDSSLVKNIIEGIATPLTHIYNLSLKMGVFPQKIKIAQSYFII